MDGDSERRTQLDRLIARQAICDLHATYMHGQDRLDAAKHLSVFHDDATCDYGELKGSAKEFVTWAQAALRDMHSTHHLIGQALIDFESDTLAFGEVYFQAFHRGKLDGADIDLFISGRYVDRYEKRAGRWKIAHRTEIIDWERVEPMTPGYLSRLAPRTIWGARGDADRARQRDLLRRL